MENQNPNTQPSRNPAARPQSASLNIKRPNSTLKNGSRPQSAGVLNRSHSSGTCNNRQLHDKQAFLEKKL